MDENFRSSPVYQRTLEKGIAISEAKSKDLDFANSNAQILTQARLKVMQIVLERFLSLAGLAREVLAAINDPGLLFLIVVKLAQIQSTEEAQEFLLCLHPQFVNRT